MEPEHGKGYRNINSWHLQNRVRAFDTHAAWENVRTRTCVRNGGRQAIVVVERFENWRLCAEWVTLPGERSIWTDRPGTSAK